MKTLEDLDNDALVASLRTLVCTHRRVTADILQHLGEIEERRIHLLGAYPSLFEYCLNELKFSEDEAYRRIAVARLARRFPAMLPLLAEGRASLSVLALLKPYATDENVAELLAGVSGLTFKRAQQWLAARFPQSAVPDAIRKLPEPRAVAPSPTLRASLPAVMAPVVTPAAPSPTAPPAMVVPLAEDRFAVKLTVTGATRDKLELVRDLMRHRNPEGKLDAILDAALDALLDKLRKAKLGHTDRPRAPKPEKSARATSRHTRRKVVERDGLCCSFVSADGRRCNARAFLEFDHIEPVGKNGGPELSNRRLLCRAHNRLEAERVYGRAHIEASITQSRRRRDVIRDVANPGGSYVSRHGGIHWPS